MSTDDDIFSGLGIEVKMKTDEDFLKVKETLTRIGVESRKTKTLFQSCHILHKRGRYAIMHFKELFTLDGKPSDLSVEDTQRRNTIVNLLEEWELLDVVNGESFKQQELAPMSQIKIIPHSQKREWTLKPKYNIGNKRR